VTLQDNHISVYKCNYDDDDDDDNDDDDDDDDDVALNSEESGKRHCTNTLLSLVGLDRSGGVPSSHPLLNNQQRIATERRRGNTPI